MTILLHVSAQLGFNAGRGSHPERHQTLSFDHKLDGAEGDETDSCSGVFLDFFISSRTQAALALFVVFLGPSKTIPGQCLSKSTFASRPTTHTSYFQILLGVKVDFTL